MGTGSPAVQTVPRCDPFHRGGAQQPYQRKRDRRDTPGQEESVGQERDCKNGIRSGAWSRH